jgi:photoactive yellow protein
MSRPDLTITDFDAPELIEILESSELAWFDDLPFGVITMARNGDVVGYNQFESRRAGIDAHRVLGRNFFESVGPCTNNYLVAQRYLDEPELDETIDFTFTLRMSPTPVQLRMLARAGSERQYLVVIAR